MNMSSSTDDDPWISHAEDRTETLPRQSALHVESIEGVEPLDTQIGVFPKKTVPDALYDALFGQPTLPKTEIAAAGGEPAVVPPMHTYAILDAAKLTNLPELLERSGLEHRCLFKGDAYDELQNVAPWIIQLKEGNSFTRNLFTRSEAHWHLWDKEPGIYVRSRRALDDMWRHFRKFTKIRNERDDWLYLRWWEQNFWYLALQKQVGQVQNDLTSPLDALVVPLKLPIFGDRWLSIRTEDRGAGGEYRVNVEDLENIKLTANLRDSLMVLNLHSPSGVSFEVKIACIRALDKDFLPQAAPAVAQTAGSGRIRPRSRCFLAQGRRFSAQRTDLSSRFRSV